MKSKIKTRFSARAEVMKAMAHPTRLFMVDVLSRGRRCVCELTEMVGDDISTISRHLSVLKSAGVVEREKRGTQVFYSLRLPCALKFLSCVDRVLEADAKARAALVE